VQGAYPSPPRLNCADPPAFLWPGHARDLEGAVPLGSPGGGWSRSVRPATSFTIPRKRVGTLTGGALGYVETGLAENTVYSRTSMGPNAVGTGRAP